MGLCSVREEYVLLIVHSRELLMATHLCHVRHCFYCFFFFCEYIWSLSDETVCPTGGTTQTGSRDKYLSMLVIALILSRLL